jgi:predicted ABC-type transport system involved in lysophospholipase L1 biosynthesis ATPase subunit
MPAAPAVEVLRGVDLEVAAGESLAIVGPSGSGKTTLLQLIGLLDVPDEGAVLLAGEDVAAWDEPRRALLRQEYIGFVFQLHHLLPQLTVLENVLVPAWAAGCRPEHEERARELLARVGLAERSGHRPGQLSGGERQRAALVRALLLRPALLLADEPTGSLDHAGAAELAALLVELNEQEQVTLITVTHSLELAARLSRTLRLQDGVLHPPAAIREPVNGSASHRTRRIDHRALLR